MKKTRVIIAIVAIAGAILLTLLLNTNKGQLTVKSIDVSAKGENKHYPEQSKPNQSREAAASTAPSRMLPDDSVVQGNNSSPAQPGQTKIIKLGPREKAAFTGEEAIASVQVGDVRYDLTPNQLKMFPRITGIQPGQTLPVEVSYPKGTEGEPVVIEAQDGGGFENKKVLRVNNLDSAKNLAFAFTAGQQPGVYRVVLRKGDDQKTLDFWVGPEAPLKRFDPVSSTNL